MRQRPTVAMLEGSDPYTGWIPMDYRLADAVSQLERDTCKSCGNPVWLCHSTHPGIEFDFRKSACYGKAELEDYEKNLPAGVAPLEDGEYRYVVAVGSKNDDGTFDPLPSRAEALKLLAN